VLRAKEHTPTPSPSVVFTFGLAIESIKELGGASVHLKEVDDLNLKGSIDPMTMVPLHKKYLTV